MIGGLAAGTFSIAGGIFTCITTTEIASALGPINFIGTNILLGFLVYSIKSATHQIFDQFNWQSNRRSLTEWSFTLISATLLAASAAVGLELAPSKRIALATMGFGLMLLLGVVIVLIGVVNVIEMYIILQNRRQNTNPTTHLPIPPTPTNLASAVNS